MALLCELCQVFEVNESGSVMQESKCESQKQWLGMRHALSGPANFHIY